MGIIRLLLIAVLVVGGYWAFYVYASGEPYDEIGTAINSRLPTDARAFSCAELKRRHGATAAKPPAGCEPYWTAL
ncbi:UNVERIFIED_ORG: hypothetical protein ABID33_004172 [Xanthobacter viscosus]|jgi:hypothetical protein|uniref:Uncharacterized protein n=1 Tax=Xanthobacter autotrophicus TaxID=280 RepID=A0A6C1KM90_XANAU|nr:hypothetical protein [Xanthobacter autotrophicus]TLX44254.1 hypothetical protein FBQ73_03970 [Xanthobacter autotrophicus]